MEQSDWEAWQSFNLEGNREKLFEQAQTIAQNQDMNKPMRAKLLDESKRWAALPPAEKTQEVGKLIKLFQLEIDRLTKAENYAETAFLSLCQDLTKLPDPSEALRKKANTKEVDEELEHRLAAENQKLRAELFDLTEELETIHGQDDIIQALEQDIENLKQGMERQIREKIQEKEKSFKEALQIEIDKLHEREAMIAEQNNSRISEIEEIQKHNVILQTQLMDIKQAHYEDLRAKQLELDMAISEIEKFNQEYSLLKEKAVSPAPAAREENKSELEATLVQRDIEINGLRKSLAEATEKCEQLNVSVASLQEENTRQSLEIQNLSAELKKAPSVTHLAKLEKKVRKLKEIVGKQENIVWSASDVEDEKMVRHLEVDTIDRDDRPSSTSSLLVKTRNLENEMVKLKTSLQEKTSETEMLKRKVEILNVEIQKRQNVIEQWEADIHAQDLSSQGSESTDALVETGNRGLGVGANHTTQMILHQRDLYKEKIQSLESSNAMLQGTVQNQAAEIKRLTAEHLKLFKNIKLMESNWGQKNSTPVDVTMDKKFMDLYEENVSPFAKLNRKNEKLSALYSMNPAEKLLLTTIRFFISTRKTRLALFSYMVLLHLLVFFSLAAVTHVTS
eukprot:TRINITY_DN3194_c0_g1_i1.p1 TRINITY_DN3194_c0_g1~~TRINITY_DN3194_c0_g1_i1.p1  ORF type:complete len:628 (-),score=161.15 TRINITY_DN3194_c0_g1_i1:122-1984(-)